MGLMAVLPRAGPTPLIQNLNDWSALVRDIVLNIFLTVARLSAPSAENEAKKANLTYFQISMNLGWENYSGHNGTIPARIGP